MTRRFHSHGNRSFKHSGDAIHATSIYRYLGLLAAACAIAYIFSGSATIWVWIATAIVLLWTIRIWRGGSGANKSYYRSKGRRC